MPALSLRPWQLSTLVATFIVAASNQQLFADLFTRLDLASLAGIGFLLLITALMILLLDTMFLVLGIGVLFKPLLAIALLACAVLAFFVNSMGVVFDEEMFRNVFDTVAEHNRAEALELLSWPLLLHVVAFGLVPAVLLFFVKVSRRPLLLELRDRAAVLLSGLIVVAALGFSDYRYTTFFAVENRDLRFEIVPIVPIVSMVKLVQKSTQSVPVFHDIGGDAVQNRTGKRPVVGVVVVGETARADHFSLNGYDRETNPRLQAQEGLVALTIESCGTSTAYSVPCMFFLRGHDNYSPETARGETNLLDLLSSAGVETVWIDNNSSCKHVCDRIESVNLRMGPDGVLRDEGEYDIVLTDALSEYLDAADADRLIVLHMMGSHGPAYSRRYPEAFAEFAPYCHKMSPTECTADEVVNAYDNTILYTDFVLQQLIRTLQQHADAFDTFLVYASDHGESLGENGVYLHGLPAPLAPASQTHVPMLVWMSPQYRASHRFTRAASPSDPNAVITHDNFPQTVLGLFDIESPLYRPDADLFAAARSGDAGSDIARLSLAGSK